MVFKPAPSSLLATLWALKDDGLGESGLSDLSGLAASGRTSLPLDGAIPKPLYRIVGYAIAGERAVRIDILERLADLIRPLIAWRATEDEEPAPEGAAPGNGFTVTVAMTSLLGCSGEDFASVLRGLGYRAERRPLPTVAAPPTPNPPSQGEYTEPVLAAAAAAESPAGEEPESADGDTSTQPTSEVDAGRQGADGEEPDIAEPAFLEIWRPARRDRTGTDRSGAPRRRRASRQPKSAASGQGDADAAATAAKQANKGKRPPRKAGKRQFDSARDRGATNRSASPQKSRADPDSPFAALAALKTQLENKDGGG